MMIKIDETRYLNPAAVGLIDAKWAARADGTHEFELRAFVAGAEPVLLKGAQASDLLFLLTKMTPPLKPADTAPAGPVPVTLAGYRHGQ